MPSIEWTPRHTPSSAPDGPATVVVFASEFTAPNWRTFVSTARSVPAIARQLRTSDGALGFRLHADLRRRRMTTVSTWRDAAALGAFASADPHRSTMSRLAGRLGTPTFVTADVSPSDAHLDADLHLARHDPSATTATGET